MSDKTDPWYQPPTIYYRGEERFGTPEQMIDEIIRLRDENTVAFNKGQNVAFRIIAEYLGIEPGCSHARVKEAITRLRTENEALTKRCVELEKACRAAEEMLAGDIDHDNCTQQSECPWQNQHRIVSMLRDAMKEPNHDD